MGGWATKGIDFDFTLNNPTFVVDMPNGIAIHVIWNEDDPNRDYTSRGIDIINGQVLIGPYGSWREALYDFTFRLVNPTFYVNRPNCPVVRIIWGEYHPTLDYSAEGIEIVGGQVVLGPNGTNTVFIQADKYDSLAADIPITIRNTSYTGLTERVIRTDFTPMHITFQNDIYSVASGNWNDPAIWSLAPEGMPGVTAPEVNDEVFISGHKVIVNSGGECKKITLSNKKTGSELLVQNGRLVVLEKIVIQNVNRKNGECKLIVSQSGELEVSHSDQIP